MSPRLLSLLLGVPHDSHTVAVFISGTFRLRWYPFQTGRCVRRLAERSMPKGGWQRQGWDPRHLQGALVGKEVPDVP